MSYSPITKRDLAKLLIYSSRIGGCDRHGCLEDPLFRYIGSRSLIAHLIAIGPKNHESKKCQSPPGIKQCEAQEEAEKMEVDGNLATFSIAMLGKGRDEIYITGAHHESKCKAGA